jgi:Na+/H+ antiporter NhaD/arsenite permease-like protein
LIRNMTRIIAGFRALAALVALFPLPTLAAAPGQALSGADLPLIWALPFAGLLLSIAIVPLFAAHFWHAHFGKVAAAWAAALLVPFAVTFGGDRTIHHVAHAMLEEYVPFVVILFALYTISGGICFRGSFVGTPWLNTGILALGAVLASIMGTTGASMLLIRPLLTANEVRKRKVHSVVFFILLVGNVGGALSPLGDPPLFIGFLKGVDFFWTMRFLAAPTAFLVAALLVIYFALDLWLYRKDGRPKPALSDGPRFAVEGSMNLLLIAAVIGAVLMSGLWKPGIEFDIFGAHVALQNLLRDLALVALALMSLAMTPKTVREHNAFHWAPIVEVAKIFAGIFLTIIPVIAMLAAGRDGAFSGVVSLVIEATGAPRNTAVFWIAGVLSAFLDNAPTYLVFFNLAGGDATALMTTHRLTLEAISMGAVYFGALTYIGNAPNFMIKAVAEDRGLAMPSFFGFITQAALVMLPLLAVVTVLFL